MQLRKKDGRIELYSSKEDNTSPSNGYKFESTSQRLNYKIHVRVQAKNEINQAKIQLRNNHAQTSYGFGGASGTGSGAGIVSSVGFGGVVNCSNHAFRRVFLASNACLALSRSSCDDTRKTYSSVFET